MKPKETLIEKVFLPWKRKRKHTDGEQRHQQHRHSGVSRVDPKKLALSRGGTKSLLERRMRNLSEDSQVSPTKENPKKGRDVEIISLVQVLPAQKHMEYML